MILYHFTCADHGGPGIWRTRTLVPFRHPLLGVSLVWLTDLPVPHRYGLGLTCSWITCDRTQLRVEVEANADVERWARWAQRHRTPRVLRDVLEQDALPAHWWVSDRPLPVRALTDRHGRPVVVRAKGA